MDRAELIRQVRAGEYVVDPHAVAGAMLSHAATRDLLMRPAGRSDQVLEACEGDGLPGGADQGDAAPGADPA